VDFFERQRVARRQSVRLVVLFVLAVAAIAAITAAVVTLAVHFFYLKTTAIGLDLLWRGPLPWVVAAVTAGIIAVSSVAKRRELSGGGDVLARALGGRPVSPATKDLKQRQLLNVVEELALAAGTPVPRVFLLEQERGINAFAAGLEPTNAAVAVTRGAVELLTRDELQGVLAHEFSHILNGDMALNLRLMTLLHGILVLSQLGRRLAVPKREERRFGRSVRSKGEAVPMAIGALVWAIGSIGVLFARLIKAGVSRERERLADAAAVQFTRNAAGLAGALKKIGGLAEGSRMHGVLAEAASHLFFGDGLVRGALDLFPTHPPLLERIRWLDPSFDGSFPPVQSLSEVQISLPASEAERRVPLAAPSKGVVRAEPEAVAESIGQPRPEHLEHARAVCGTIGTRLTEAVRTPNGAEAVVYALLLDRDERVRKLQRVVLASHPDETVLCALGELLPEVDRCPAGARLPLLDLALPALRALSEQQYRLLRDHVQKLIATDRNVTLFEYTLHRALLRYLDAHFLKLRPPATQYYTLKQLQQPCAVVLSALAYLGQRDDGAAAAAFGAGTAELASMDAKPSLAARAACGVQAVHEALTRLATVAAKPKGEVLRACVATVARDGIVTVGEAELLRAVADGLGCPMPPLLPVRAEAARRAASEPQKSARTSTAP
jgi:Zn-dependent protease with chaperone function